MTDHESELKAENEKLRGLLKDHLYQYSCNVCEKGWQDAWLCSRCLLARATETALKEGE